MITSLGNGHAAAVDQHEHEHDEEAPAGDPLANHAAHRPGLWPTLPRICAARFVQPSIPPWPVPFDAGAELDWGRPEYARRLLREHLDQTHDGASRRRSVIAGQVRRLRRLLPPAPARILDAGCGPGLYAVPLAALGHEVTGIDVSAPALRHARGLARETNLLGHGSLRQG